MNLFILAATNMHSIPFIHYLTNICGIEKTSIKILFFDIKSEQELNTVDAQTLKDISIHYSSEWYDPVVYENVKNITISSLSSVNNQAEFVFKLFNLGFVSYEQLIIRITDDEVDRWSSLVNKHGRMIESKESHVDHYTLSILEQTSRFICLFNPWGKELEKILQKDLEIYDTGIYSNPITNDEIYDFISSNLRNQIRAQMETSSTIRIMLHTKPKPNYIVRNILSKSLLPFLINHNNLLDNRTLEVFLWWPGIRDMPALNVIIATLLGISKFKKCKLKFNFINEMPTEVYLSLISSIHVLIAQDRGGLGAINEASKNGSIIVLNKGSFNEAVFSGYQKLPFIGLSHIEDTFIEPMKLLKSNGFEALIKEQHQVTTDFFNKQIIKSKEILSDIYK